jgi:hypothetical protein
LGTSDGIRVDRWTKQDGTESHSVLIPSNVIGGRYLNHTTFRKPCLLLSSGVKRERILLLCACQKKIILITGQRRKFSAEITFYYRQIFPADNVTGYQDVITA